MLEQVGECDTGRLFQSRGGPAAASPRRELVLIMTHLKLSDDRS